jgi:hypothetical protein
MAALAQPLRQSQHMIFSAAESHAANDLNDVHFDKPSGDFSGLQ